MKDRFNLEGKVAIITGASKGIGASIATAYAEAGAHVVVSSRSQDAVDKVATAINDRGLSAMGVACNVGDSSQLENLVNKTKDKYGGIDILVNNAATNPSFEPISEVSGDVFDHIMNVNVKACHTLANLCLPYMVSKRKGSVINIASVEGLRPSNGLGMYSVSKAALIMLTKSQAKEWGSVGVRSNTICPGLIQTKFSQALWENEKILKTVESHLPSGRMAQPDEMVGLSLLLASEAGSYMTGGVYTADGGHMLIG